MHKSESEDAQSCLTLSDPMDRSLPGSSIHGIFQARVLEWVAIAFSPVRSSWYIILVKSFTYLVIFGLVLISITESGYWILQWNFLFLHWGVSLTSYILRLCWYVILKGQLLSIYNVLFLSHNNFLSQCLFSVLSDTNKDTNALLVIIFIGIFFNPLISVYLGFLS